MGFLGWQEPGDDQQRQTFMLPLRSRRSNQPKKTNDIARRKDPRRRNRIRKHADLPYDEREVAVKPYTCTFHLLPARGASISRAGELLPTEATTLEMHTLARPQTWGNP